MVIISENEMARPGSGPSNRRGAPLRTDRVAALGAAAKLDIEDLPSHGSHGDVSDRGRWCLASPMQI